jgi:hypothetical protein
VPGVLLAGLFGWTPRVFFDAGPGTDQPPRSLTDDGVDAGS